MRTLLIPALSCIVLTVLPAVPARAQARSAPAAITTRSAISANPLLLVFEWFNVEFEHRSSSSSTIGVQASTFRTSDDRYFSGRAFWRYYPREAFGGFFFGLRAGVTGVDGEDDSGTAFGAGFEIGVAWMLGSQRRFYVSLGTGADRLIGSDFDTALPTFRLVNIGWGF